MWLSLMTLKLLALLAKSLEGVSSKGKHEGAVQGDGALHGGPEHLHDGDVIFSDDLGDDLDTIDLIFKKSGSCIFKGKA